MVSLPGSYAFRLAIQGRVPDSLMVRRYEPGRETVSLIPEEAISFFLYGKRSQDYQLNTFTKYAYELVNEQNHELELSHA